MDRSRGGRTAACLAALGLLLGLLLVAPVAPSAAAACDDRDEPGYQPVTGAIFNNPTGKVADQYRILQTVVRNIEATPAGEEIRIATLAIAAKAVVEALTEADRCGVRVKVLVPGRAWEDNGVVALREALGTDTSRNSFITRCEGSCTTDGADGIMHVKSYLFSKVHRVGNVTMYSSSNLTRNQAATRWNDAYQVTRDRDVYSAAATFFDKLTKDKPIKFARLTKAAGYWQYNFPSSQDFHLDLLDRTECKSAAGTTTIDFVASIWKQVAVAEKVADLYDAGCDIRVALNLERIEQRVLDLLLDRDVPTRVQPVDDPDGATHSKYIAIQGMHDGYVVSTVYCGSPNVSNFSVRTANNNMLRIVDDETAYAAYHGQFDRLWEAGRPLERADVEAAGKVDARSAEAQD